MTAATPAHVEYVGFRATVTRREYTLRVRQGVDAEDFTLVIPNEAFLAHRARYQDAPEICYLKLQRELAASPGTRPARLLSVTDQDLEEYRVAHAPKSPGRAKTPPSQAPPAR
ncbi:MAG: hypothetical protein A2V74_01285 [Acidobacteria bacterium RBG_16_70_10]|nr:MAG: hypothetical protein A2V74_01285 [Acidobacteria bacterium RBG_16_70_10]